MHNDLDNKPVSKLCIRRDYSLHDLLMEIEGPALEHLTAIVDAGAGEHFISTIIDLYGDCIDYGELLGILNGPEAYEICGLNSDGTKNDDEWGADINDAGDDEDLNEQLEILNCSANCFDRMPDGFPTIVRTINEDDPDCEEKFNAIRNLVYDVSNDVTAYDISLEDTFENSKGQQEIELVIDPVYNDEIDPEDREDDKQTIADLIKTLIDNYGFRTIDFDGAEIDVATLPCGKINKYDGDISALRDELAHTHSFEEPCEIRQYLEDNGFNVVDTDDGNGFEAWYEDPETNSKEYKYIKFLTNSCWDEIYGPCCRLNESTFRIVHPKKTKRQ